ncbi:NACHT domain-containing protein [Streptosporangium sp. NPDC000563]|uniref:NACHT domain-containing protein n=1 Tax=Streptosporangium sp. NPDC000563 TaxID=3154366 RepID=UPI00331E77BC
MSGRLLKWMGIAVFATTVSAMGLYLFTRDGLAQADQSASVIGAFIGLSALALTLYMRFADRRTPSASSEETIAAAKKALTVLVIQQWRTEEAIRSLDEPEPIPISWRLVDDASLMDHPRLVGEHALTFSGSSDEIPALADAFQTLRRRRLIITGGPGTGKTTLAIQLLLHLAGPERREADPVPVLVPVNGWDTAAYPRLHDWLATRLSADYPALRAAEFGADAAHALVTYGHILPILDGLDEIPPPARIAVISALNRWLASDDQFILTSRTTEYAQAVRQAGDVLTATAVIAPAAITTASAETYLRTCLPPVSRHDWTPVWSALRDGCCPGLSKLAETALGLWLIRTVYITPAADPAALTGVLAQQETTLRTHLFDHLIAAVINSRPPSSDSADYFRPRTAWNPERARDHLAYLARLLRDHNTYDLAWWHLAQHTVPGTERRRAVRESAVTMGIWGGFTVVVMIALLIGVSEPPLFLMMIVLMIWLMFDLTFTLSVGLETWFAETPGYADLHLSGRTADLIAHVRNALANGLTFGILGGLVLGLMYGFANGLIYGLAGGLAVGLVYGILGGFIVGFVVGFADGMIKWAEQPASSTAATLPLTSWKADRALTLLRVVTLGLAVGLPVGLLAGSSFGRLAALAAGFAGGLPVGLPVGLASGLAAGLMVGLSRGLTFGNHHAWLAYTIAVRRLAKKEHLPRELMAFLDDAHRLGLLRTIGPIYQFRHAELQDHLAAPPSSSSEPTSRAAPPRSTENAI